MTDKKWRDIDKITIDDKLKKYNIKNTNFSLNSTIKIEHSNALETFDFFHSGSRTKKSVEVICIESGSEDDRELGAKEKSEKQCKYQSENQSESESESEAELEGVEEDEEDLEDTSIKFEPVEYEGSDSGDEEREESDKSGESGESDNVEEDSGDSIGDEDEDEEKERSEVIEVLMPYKLRPTRYESPYFPSPSRHTSPPSLRHPIVSTSLPTSPSASPSSSRQFSTSAPVTPTTSTSLTRRSTTPPDSTTSKVSPNSSRPSSSSAPTTPSSTVPFLTPPRPSLTPFKNNLYPAKPKKSPLKVSQAKGANIMDYFKSLHQEIEKNKKDQQRDPNYDPVVEISRKLDEVKTAISHLSPLISPLLSSSRETSTKTTTTTTYTTTTTTTTTAKQAASATKQKRKRRKKRQLPQKAVQKPQAQQSLKKEKEKRQVKDQQLEVVEDDSSEDVDTNSAPIKRRFYRPSVVDGRVICLFCGKAERESTCEGQMMYEKRLGVNIHFECLYSTNRSKHESITQMISRVAGFGKRLLNCKHCKQKCASVGCGVNTCAKVYHYKCAIDAEGKWDPASWEFYCKEHYEDKNRNIIPEYKRRIKWPRSCKVRYLRNNIWDEIKPTHRDYIARYARIEGSRAGDPDDTWTVAWESQDFTPRIMIREIGPGHWAWCNELAGGLKARNRQYEAVASQYIARDDFIGEYVGRVRYEDPSKLRNPYVTSMFVPLNAKFRSKMGPAFRGLCVDSSSEGNETRFINSVTRHSPHHIRQNATMDTVWCRGQLRVIIHAITDIPEGWPIVLDYDEYIKEDGSHPYFDSDSEPEPEGTQAAYFVNNNTLLPTSTVVVPLIPLDYKHPKKKPKI